MKDKNCTTKVPGMRPRRKALRLTQKKLAELVGLNRMTIVKYESGEYSPSLKTVELLAKPLECTAADLLTAPAEASADV